MWPVTLLEVLFAGGMLCLLLDVAGRSLGPANRLPTGALAAGSIAISIAVLLPEWGSTQGQLVLQPVANPLSSTYVEDAFTSLAALTVLVVGLAVALLHMAQPADRGRPGPFYSLLLILLCSLVGVVSAGDLITLFLFWEGMSVSAYGLVSLGRSRLSIEAALKYFLAAGIGSLLALYGIAAVYSATGTLVISSATLAAFSGTTYGQLGLVMLLLGLGVEGAMVPLHTWLPDVYAASPIPVASVVAGAVTGTGVFALVKLLQPFATASAQATSVFPVPQGASDVELLLGVLALATMLLGNLSALAQRNLRKMLSFSSVAQTGYMLAALSTLTLAGIVAVVFTIWNHGLLKAGFFMVIGKKGSLEDSDLEALAGAGRQNRYLGFLYGSSSLAMVGAPPFGMFWSEILIVQSLLFASTPLSTFLAVAVVVNILLSIGYYYKVVNGVVFGEARGSGERRSLAELVPPASLLGLSLVTGLLPFLILRFL